MRPAGLTVGALMSSPEWDCDRSRGGWSQKSGRDSSARRACACTARSENSESFWLSGTGGSAVAPPNTLRVFSPDVNAARKGRCPRPSPGTADGSRVREPLTAQDRSSVEKVRNAVRVHELRHRHQATRGAGLLGPRAPTRTRPTADSAIQRLRWRQVGGLLRVALELAIRLVADSGLMGLSFLDLFASRAPAGYMRRAITPS